MSLYCTSVFVKLYSGKDTDHRSHLVTDIAATWERLPYQMRWPPTRLWARSVVGSGGTSGKLCRKLCRSQGRDQGHIVHTSLQTSLPPGRDSPLRCDGRA